MGNTEGLTQKYTVFKNGTGERVENCFVLRPDKDPAAVAALRAYSEATDNKSLASDIINWVGEEKSEPLTKEQIKGMVGDWVWVEVQYAHSSCNGWGFIFTPAYVAYLDKFLSIDSCGKEFVAYRCPPKS